MPIPTPTTKQGQIRRYLYSQSRPHPQHARLYRIVRPAIAPVPALERQGQGQVYVGYGNSVAIEPDPNHQLAAHNFRLYAEDLLLDIDNYYSGFVQYTKQLAQSLRSGKSGWIEAMVRRSLIKGFDCPHIILDHTSDRFFFRYAHYQYPKLAGCIDNLRSAVDNYHACVNSIMRMGDSCPKQVYSQCLKCVLAIHYHTNSICKELKTICS